MDQAAVIEILGRDGQVLWLHKVAAWPLRLGRSPECDLVLSDPHLAGRHAELHWAEDGPRLALLPSLNGGWLDGQALAVGEPVAWGGAQVLRLGQTRLRLRSHLDSLPPERPLHAAEPRPAAGASRWQRLALPLLALLWALLLWGDQWAGSDPGGAWVDAASAVLLPLGVTLGWAALWALVTQLFRHWFAFTAHWRLTLVAAVGLHLLGLLLPAAAYALSWPRLMVLDAVAVPAGLAALVWWQAGLVWPRARRALGLGLAALLLLSLALVLGRRTEQQHWLGPSYLSVLPNPALRLATPVSVDEFVQGLGELEAPLREQAGKRNERGAASEAD
jgi:hypothetical protein